MSSDWTAVAAAGVTATATLAAVWMKSSWDYRAERRKSVRSEQREAYQRFLGQADRTYDLTYRDLSAMSDDDMHSHNNAMFELGTLRTNLFLLNSPKPVLDAVDEVISDLSGAGEILYITPQAHSLGERMGYGYESRKAIQRAAEAMRTAVTELG